MDTSTIKKQVKEKFKKVESIEAIRGNFEPKKLIETSYPKPLKRKFLVYENFGLSIEESYFWIKDMLADFGFIETEKLVDTFTTSEQSAFFGSGQVRLGAQQDKAASYLGIVGKMVKEMFQIVRDIRLYEEREEMYKRAKQGDDSAEKALKGTWIDFIDNGPQGVKASSVYGMASQLGYAVLPDLFFAAPPNLKQEDLDKYIKNLDFNDKVKAVLARKLSLFIQWRDATGKEIAARKNFTIKYLRQHYNSIKLYMNWIKPYLRNIKRLGMDAENQLSADIVGAFEGAVLEIEFLAKKPAAKPGDPIPCALATFRLRTRPVMNYGPDNQRGPSHIGRMEMTLRSYVWTEDEINAFKKIKQEEDFEMLKSIDESIEDSMKFLEDDLKKYLESWGEKFNKEERLARSLVESGAAKDIESARIKAESMLKKKEEKASGVLDPFTSILSGFKELGSSFFSSKEKAHDAKKEKEIMELKKGALAKEASFGISRVYELYKKSHRMFTP